MYVKNENQEQRQSSRVDMNNTVLCLDLKNLIIYSSTAAQFCKNLKYGF